MSTKYKVNDNSKPYYITTTIVGWVDVFTREVQKERLVESLKYCQESKGLIIYAWCLMTNHLHMICQSSDEEVPLSDIIRDFKRFTSKQILITIEEEPESRREWMLDFFKKSCEKLKRNQKYKVWQTGFHAEEIRTQKFLEQKIDYINYNPVKARIVEFPEHYIYSSARNYAEMEGLLAVEILSRSWKFFS
ncbi:REP-associated tyrosine transposase [Acidiluteibacter ferrifornacis]|uniref:Transposase n=1 Tax=Acidiluteibacter ferrifornacis TaxID=2692424 RepID=A0A6N9NEN4_9FLAO|nr:transposase [Acidiluteibacter ferrifornacis]NBG65088.1 transposase [Acidiluteibacter ferrifornacis]